MSTNAAFEQLLKESGCDTDTIDYLVAIGVKHINTMAAMAMTHEELDSRVINPFLNGWTDAASTEHKCASLHSVCRATITVTWESCCDVRHQARSAILATTMSQTQYAHSQGTQASASQPESKVPTALDPGVWQTQIRLYETSYSPERSFPQQLLIGAEKILARMMHEHLKSKQYTILQLGEILQNRVVNRVGTINTMAIKDKDKSLHIENGYLTEKHATVWSPQTTWSLIDGLEAAKWAFVFCEMATEIEIDVLTEYFLLKVRNMPDNLDTCRDMWNSGMWKISMRMRTGAQMSVAISELTTELQWAQDFHTSQSKKRDRFDDEDSVKQTRSSSRSEAWKKSRWSAEDAPTKEPKGKGKGKDGKAKGKASGGDDICKKWNKGTCALTDCKYTHCCSKCFANSGRKLKHPSTTCWSP